MTSGSATIMKVCLKLRKGPSGLLLPFLQIQLFFASLCMSGSNSENLVLRDVTAHSDITRGVLSNIQQVQYHVVVSSEEEP